MKWREVVCFPYFQISGVSKLRLKQLQLRVEVMFFREIRRVFGKPTFFLDLVKIQDFLDCAIFQDLLNLAKIQDFVEFAIF